MVGFLTKLKLIDLFFSPPVEFSTIYGVPAWANPSSVIREAKRVNTGTLLDIGECDAEVLASCYPRQALSSYKELDMASFDSFTGKHGNGSRSVLYYSPSILDSLFVTNNHLDETNWFINDEGTSITNTHMVLGGVDPLVVSGRKSNLDGADWFIDDEATSSTHTRTAMIVGGVNCGKMPMLCQGMKIPSIQIFHSYHGRLTSFGDVNCAQMPRLCRGKELSLAMNIFESIDDEDLPTYSQGVTECLLRRYGAKHLSHDSCRMSIDRWTTQRRYSSNASLVVGDPEMYILQGRRIVLVWNTVAILACGILLMSLCLAGRSIVRKYLTRFCGCGTLLLRDSKSMSKDERKKQLNLQAVYFFSAVIVLGVVNIFLPFLFLLVAGPAALSASIWMYYEFRRSNDWQTGSE